MSWPIAKALVARPGAFAKIVTLLIALPIFVSESVRLFGAYLFMMPRGGILAGTLQALFGLQVGSVLYTKTATLIGLVYIHLPFTLFPMLLGLSLVPPAQVDAATDLGASPRQIFWEIELPLALPGILIGALLTFVLSFGANAEAAILGGQAVTVIAKAIEQRFTYAQDWPLGSALTVLVAAITAHRHLPRHAPARPRPRDEARKRDPLLVARTAAKSAVRGIPSRPRISLRPTPRVRKWRPRR